MVGNIEPVEYYENEVLCKDGTRRVIAWHNSFLKDDDNRLIGLFSSGEDITERKKAEADLIRNQYYLQKAQEIGSIGTWHLNLDNNVLNWTEENYKIFGIAQNSPMNYELFINCVHPDDRKYVHNEWRIGIENKSYDIEHRIIANKKVKWVRQKAEFIINDDRQVIAAYGVTQDVNERKKAEQELKDSEFKFKSIIENSTNVFYKHDVNHKLTYLSPQIEGILGYSVKEALRLWTDFATDNPINEGGLKKTTEAIKTGKKQKPYIMELKHKKGHNIWVEVREAPVVKNEKTTEIVGVLVDITERVKFEQQLKDSEEKLNLIVSKSPFPVGVVDINNGEIVYWSESATKLTGHTPTTVTEWYNLAYPDKAYLEQVVEHWVPFEEKALKTGESVNAGEYRVSCKNGEEIICELYAQYIPGHLVVTINDVTEKKKYEEQLKIKANELDKLNNDKDEFISILAHDLKSPLNSLVAFTDILVKGVECYDTEKIKKQVRVINLAADKTCKLLHDTLMWANPETNALDPQPTYLSVLKTIDNEIDILLPVASEKGIRIKNNIKSDIEIFMNAAILKIVIRNLVNNAIKFTPENGAININAQIKPNEIVLSIADTGVGMEQSKIDSLFNISHISTSEGTKHEKGTGFGLRICNKLLRSIGSEIKVTSEVGKGSTFSFVIPLNNNSLSKNKHSGVSVSDNLPTILIVDDEVMNIALLQAFIEDTIKINCTLLEASNGQQAVELCQKQAVDMVLMDIKMPVMDGIEAAELIKAKNPALPIVFQSANIDNLSMNKARALGCEEFLPKPIEVKDLDRVMRKILK